MYKTLIQLVLLLILILIIVFIFNKYFYTNDKIDEVKNTGTLKIERDNSLNNKLDKKNIDNESMEKRQSLEKLLNKMTLKVYKSRLH